MVEIESDTLEQQIQFVAGQFFGHDVKLRAVILNRDGIRRLTTLGPAHDDVELGLVSGGQQAAMHRLIALFRIAGQLVSQVRQAGWRPSYAERLDHPTDHIDRWTEYLLCGFRVIHAQQDEDGCRIWIDDCANISHIACLDLLGSLRSLGLRVNGPRLVTIEQMAQLVQKSPKTIQNKKAECPFPDPTHQNLWRYLDVRPVLANWWPDVSHRLPESYSDAMELLRGESVQPGN